MTKGQRTMGENEFKNLFSEAEIAELQAAAEDVTAEASKPAKKNGIWYVADDATGNTSFYEVNMGGKTILHIAVDNIFPLAEIAEQFGLPQGVTAHAITVWNATRTAFLQTKGFAVRYEHEDGSGVHIDGNSVRAYVIPRVSNWIGHFYGV